MTHPSSLPKAQERLTLHRGAVDGRQVTARSKAASSARDLLVVRCSAVVGSRLDSASVTSFIGMPPPGSSSVLGRLDRELTETTVAWGDRSQQASVERKKRARSAMKAEVATSAASFAAKAPGTGGAVSKKRDAWLKQKRKDGDEQSLDSEVMSAVKSQARRKINVSY